MVIRDVNLMQKVKDYNMKPENMITNIKAIKCSTFDSTVLLFMSETREERTDLTSVPGRYLPACLIHQTGTCSVSSPRAALRNVSFFS